MKKMLVTLTVMLVAVFKMQAQSSEIFTKDGYAIGGMMRWLILQRTNR
jgi:hypothetical protein